MFRIRACLVESALTDVANSPPVLISLVRNGLFYQILDLNAPGFAEFEGIHLISEIAHEG
jgi:hypothetical protein